MPDTAASAAAVNQSPGVPGGLVRWGGLEPDTAASAAAPNGAIYLCREYLIIGVPIDKVNGVKYPTF